MRWWLDRYSDEELTEFAVALGAGGGIFGGCCGHQGESGRWPGLPLNASLGLPT